MEPLLCTIVILVWGLSVFRVVLAVSGRGVWDLYRGGGTLDTRRLADVVLVWPRGLILILGILLGRYAAPEPKRRHVLEPLRETLLAMLFVTWILFSYELAQDYVPWFRKAREWVSPYLEAAWLALVQFVRVQVDRLFF